MSITASNVKELREKTGAGMMDCKKALVETDGDMEAAIDFLRKKGLAAAQKKAGRTASQGLVAVEVEDYCGAIIEFNSETDFVARNDKFQGLAKTIATTSLKEKCDDVEALLAHTSGAKTIEALIQETIGVIGENMSLRRAELLEVTEGVVASYMHNAIVPGLGSIGVLVALESTSTDKDALHAIGKQVAMHIAATKPQSLNREGVDSSALEREKDIFAEKARASGKPEQIVEKIVEGQVNKFYSEVVLLEQKFVINPDITVGQAVEEAAKSLGAPVKMTGFKRFELGEGIEKQESDFAAEVKAAAKTN